MPARHATSVPPPPSARGLTAARRLATAVATFAMLAAAGVTIADRASAAGAARADGRGTDRVGVPGTAAALGGTRGAPQSSYAAAIGQWRRDQDAELRADDGWLSVVGLFWLVPGANRAGAGPGSEVALPAGRAPARAGVFQFAGGQVTFAAQAGVPMRVNGRAVTTAPVRLRPDIDRLVMGDFTMFVITRGERTGIRLLDRNSEARRTFTGREWYPVQPALRISARWVPYNPPRQMPIVNVLGDRSLVPSPGYAEFTVDGKTVRLEPTAEPGDAQLFFNFRDQTSRTDTYPAGRYLYAPRPTSGQVDLDFNRAVSPPCAFTAFATCPLAPRQNDLPVRIEAGEKYKVHPPATSPSLPPG